MITSRLQPVFPSRTVDAAELLTAGKCNTNYNITVSGLNEPVVVRLHVRDCTSEQKEYTLFHLVKEHVPVPQILSTIMSWVDGVLLSDVRSSQDERASAACAHEIGITLAHIGTYTFP